jgi:hypothetical protein
MFLYKGTSFKNSQIDMGFLTSYNLKIMNEQQRLKVETYQFLLTPADMLEAQAMAALVIKKAVDEYSPDALPIADFSIAALDWEVLALEAYRVGSFDLADNCDHEARVCGAAATMMASSTSF